MQTLTEVKGGSKLAELRKKIADGKPVSPATAALAKALDQFVAVGNANIIDIEVRRQRAMGNKVKKYKPKKAKKILVTVGSDGVPNIQAHGFKVEKGAVARLEETLTSIETKTFSGIIENVEKRVLKKLEARRKEAKKKFEKACSAAQREYRRELLSFKEEEKATKKKVRGFTIEMLERAVANLRRK